MPDENATSGRPSFWTSIPGILTDVATLLAAVTDLIVALHGFSQSKQPNAIRGQGQELEELARRLKNLQDNKPVCHTNGKDNTWWDYFWDYGRLGGIATDYAQYLRRHPGDDPTFNQLMLTFYDVQERNRAGTGEFDRSSYHSEIMPDEFKGYLQSLKAGNLTPDDERVFEAAIQNWYKQAGLKESIDAIEVHCKYGP